MSLITQALAIATIFLAAVVGVAKSPLGNRGVCIVSAGAAILMIFWPVLAGQAALTFLLAVPCALFRFKPKVVIASAVVAMAVSCGLAFMATPDFRRLETLREEFPLVSLSNRLAYENRAKTWAAPAAAPGLAPQVEQRLEQFEGRRIAMARQNMLQWLHDRTFDDFVQAGGFGPARMPEVRREWIALPDKKPIPLPARAGPEYDPDSRPLAPLPPMADGRTVGRRLLEPSDLLSLHSSGLDDFFSPWRSGYVQDRDHVAGFESHRFTEMPRLLEANFPRTDWRLVRLELISLLKHDTPVAYISEHLPQMDELTDAPTRPLDAFEQASLNKLRSDEDLAIEETARRIRMVGSLRAAKDCTECHSVRRGDLLGAFSYELTPLSPPPFNERSGDDGRPET